MENNREVKNLSLSVEKVKVQSDHLTRKYNMKTLITCLLTPLAFSIGLLSLSNAMNVQAQTAAPTASATAPASAPVRIRAMIEKIDGNNVTVKDRRGEIVNLVLASNLVVSEVYPIDISDIKVGSFVGSGALPQPDGTLRAVEVLVFPEAMRGTGEGHRAWDLLPQSTMTNATVDEVLAGVSANGVRTLRLKYKDGEKTLVVPAGAPIVTLKPADRSLLVVGAHLILTAELRDGQPTATRITAGRNGFQPPM